MEFALKPDDPAKWTVVTYLPFLWRPEQHMFLKREATKDFAMRVGHRFASDTSPGSMPRSTTACSIWRREQWRSSPTLKPRDRIGVQSFVWVVGNYKEEMEKPMS